MLRKACVQTRQRLLNIKHSLIFIPNWSKSPRFLKKARQKLLNIRLSLIFIPDWSKSTLILLIFESSLPTFFQESTVEIFHNCSDLPHLNKSQHKLPQIRLPQTLPSAPLPSLNLPQNFHQYLQFTASNSILGTKRHPNY